MGGSLILIYNGVFCFSGRGYYIDKNDLLVIRAEEAYKYSFFDSDKFKDKKIALLMFDNIKEYKDYYKNFYKNETQLIMFRFGYDTFESYEEKLLNSKADVFYLMYHIARLGEFIDYFGKKYKISAILTDKNVVLIRMMKK